MKNNHFLLCGPLLSVVLLSGIAVLPFFVPGYSQIRQTVSEIYEVGSPAQIPFSIMLLIVALLASCFAIGVYGIARARRRGALGAYFVGAFAITATGLALCPFPHPLHNMFWPF